MEDLCDLNIKLYYKLVSVYHMRDYSLILIITLLGVGDLLSNAMNQEQGNTKIG
jgi:hypothetical protein